MDFTKEELDYIAKAVCIYRVQLKELFFREIVDEEKYRTENDFGWNLNNKIIYLRSKNNHLTDAEEISKLK